MIHYNGILSDKQESFCYWYVRLRNGTKAAEKAGYSPKTACAIGSENLRKPLIIERVEFYRKKRDKRTYVDADKIRDRLAAIAFSELSDIQDDDGNVKPLSQLPKSKRVAVKSIKYTTNKFGGTDVEITQHDPVRAAIELAKMEGMYDLDNQQKKQTVVLNFGDTEEQLDDIF